VLALDRDQVRHLHQLAAYLQPIHIPEALIQMRLDPLRVLRLRQNLQQILVAKEVQPGEDEPLRLEVVLQRPLYLLHLHGIRLQALEQVRRRGSPKRIRLIVRAPHQLLPELLDRVERLGLGHQLPLDVLCGEDLLQVQPPLLAQDPLVQRLREQGEPPVPVLYKDFDRGHVPRGLDGGHGYLALLEQDLDLVRGCDDEGVARVVFDEAQVGLFPGVDYLVEHGLEGGLVGGQGADVCDLLAILQDLGRGSSC